MTTSGTEDRATLHDVTKSTGKHPATRKKQGSILPLNSAHFLSDQNGDKALGRITPCSQAAA